MKSGRNSGIGRMQMAPIGCSNRINHNTKMDCPNTNFCCVTGEMVINIDEASNASSDELSVDAESVIASL